jgi:hypothetical protein
MERAATEIVHIVTASGSGVTAGNLP